MSGKPAGRTGAAFRPLRRIAGAVAVGRHPSSVRCRLLVVALTVLAGPAAPGARAFAASPGSLHARAAAIAAEVAADNARLEQLGRSYVAATSELEAAEAGERRSRARLTRLAGELATARATLTTAAVDAYVAGGTDNAASLYLTDAPDQALTGSTYLHAASDVLEGAVVAYGEEQRNLTTTLTLQKSDAARAAAARQVSLTARDTTLSDVGAERALLSSVNGQLAAAVAAEEAARERAAAEAAAAAAARAAAAQAAAAAASAAAASSATTTTVVAAGPPPANAISTVNLGAPPPASLSAAFAAIRNCESSGDYALDTGNGYYGAYQFSESTWEGLGGSGYPNQATPAAQDAAAYLLYQRDGWAAWPECAAITGVV